LAAAAGPLYFAGYSDELTMTVFGFIFSMLVFMGVAAALPWRVSQPYSPKR